MHPLAHQVVADIGFDPSELYAKDLDEFFAKGRIAYVVIVCDQAEEKK